MRPFVIGAFLASVALGGCVEREEPASSETTDLQTVQQDVPSKSVSEDNARLQRIVDSVIDEGPLLAVVRDVSVDYPEYTDSDPDDYFEEILVRTTVRVVEPLNGSLPESFHYYTVGEYDPGAAKPEIDERPYIVSLCRSGDIYIADAQMGTIGRDDALEGFEAALRESLSRSPGAGLEEDGCRYELPGFD